MSRRTRPDYERDDAAFPADAYRMVRGSAGVAWRVLGWEVEPDEDTEWSGMMARTGLIVAIMVGDDARFTFDADEVEPLDELDYCAECGQIGCTHDGRDRSDDDEQDEAESVLTMRDYQ